MDFLITNSCCNVLKAFSSLRQQRTDIGEKSQQLKFMFVHSFQCMMLFPLLLLMQRIIRVKVAAFLTPEPLWH